MEGQRPLGAIPRDEYRCEQHRIQSTRDCVWHREAHMQHVGAHRPEHADGANRQPVRPSDVAPDRELQGQRGDKPTESEHHSDHRIDRVHAPIRRRLTHRRRESLDHPEGRRNRGHPQSPAPREGNPRRSKPHAQSVRANLTFRSRPRRLDTAAEKGRSSSTWSA